MKSPLKRKKEEEQPKKKRVKFSKNKKEKKDSEKAYYCSEHGKNYTHNTDKCFVLNKKKDTNPSKKKTFTNKGLKQEINMLARKSSKRARKDLSLIQEPWAAT